MVTGGYIPEHLSACVCAHPTEENSYLTLFEGISHISDGALVNITGSLAKEIAKRVGLERSLDIIRDWMTSARHEAVHKPPIGWTNPYESQDQQSSEQEQEKDSDG